MKFFFTVLTMLLSTSVAYSACEDVVKEAISIIKSHDAQNKTEAKAADQSQEIIKCLHIDALRDQQAQKMVSTTFEKYLNAISDLHNDQVTFSHQLKILNSQLQEIKTLEQSRNFSPEELAALREHKQELFKFIPKVVEVLKKNALHLEMLETNLIDYVSKLSQAIKKVPEVDDGPREGNRDVRTFCLDSSSGCGFNQNTGHAESI